MTKLNSNVQCEKLINSDVSNYLSEFLNNIGTSFDLNVQNITDQKKVKHILDQFYNNHYEKLNANGILHRKNIKINERLSTHEASIINYYLGDICTTRPFVLLGHAGVGKSTLLKYIAYYLHINNSGLRKVSYPVYISLTDLSAQIETMQRKTETNINEFYTLIDESIYKGTRKTTKDYLCNECEKSKISAILDWINNNIDEFFGKITNELKNQAVQDIEDYISKLSVNEKIQFFLGVLQYRAMEEEVRITLFMDNIDRFSIDIHFDCLRYADSMQNKGFQTVLAMRYSTYKYIDNIISEKFDIVDELHYSCDTVKQILLKRIQNSQDKIQLSFGYSMSAEAKDIVAAFAQLLMSGASLNTLVELSNGSLDKLFNKLKMMAKSAYFNENLIASELLHSKIDGHYRTKGIPIWMMYSMLFGNCGESFKSLKLQKTGIINLFCNQSFNHSPYTFFSRIHLLARLIKVAESREERYIPAITWIEQYRELFGTDMNFHATFSRTALRLIQEGLVHTKNCTRYADEEQIENQFIQFDSVAISPAGVFYIKQLIMKIEYIYFMKDDIRWASNNIPFTISRVSDSLYAKFKYSIQALLILLEYEKNMLIRLREESTRNKANLVKKYVDKFSPLNRICNTQTMLYTRCIYNHCKIHIEHTAPGYLDSLRDEIDIHKLEEVSEIESTYMV